MKRLKYILIIIFISILFITPKARQVNKIEVDIKENEILINFIFNSDFNALYIQDNGVNSLIVLDYKIEEKDIEKMLKKHNIDEIDILYTITPVILNIFDVQSKYLQTENNLIILNYNNNNFCIYVEEYQESTDLNICKFLYVVKFKTGILKDLIGNPEVVFQTEMNPLPIKTQELIYDNWTELYTINNNEYTILKISKDGFDTLIIPKEKAE